jgi:hypothetical protein
MALQDVSGSVYVNDFASDIISSDAVSDIKADKRQIHKVA